MKPHNRTSSLMPLLALATVGYTGMEPSFNRNPGGVTTFAPLPPRPEKTQPPRPYRRPLKERKERNRKKRQRRL